MGTAEDAKAELLRVAPEVTLVPGVFTRMSRIGFYPASGLDAGPLQRFHALCDLFVYADWRIPYSDFRAWLEVLKPAYASISTFLLKTEVMAEVARSPLPDNLPLPPPQEMEPWGCVVHMTADHRHGPSSTQMLFVCAEAVRAFTSLFLNQKITPRLVCMIRQTGFAGNWTDFSRWDQPLGRLASRLPTAPQYLATAFPHEHNWPDYEWLGRLESWNRPGCSPDPVDLWAKVSRESWCSRGLDDAHHTSIAVV